MSEPGFLKCPCQKCGSSIEFPAHGAGVMIDCPHCRQKTILFRQTATPEPEKPAAAASTPRAPATDAPLPQRPSSPPPAVKSPAPATPPRQQARPTAPPPSPTSTPPSPPSPRLEAPAPPRRRSPVLAAVIAIVAILAIGGGVLGLLNRQAAHRAKAPDGPIETAASDRPPDPTPAVSPAAATTSSPKPPRASSGPKSPADFKTGAIAFEKAGGGSLVYAVGTVTNDSSHQRYGVRIEVSLNDADGKAAGIAKDYRQVMEPGESWRFRALILDSRAKTGSISSITEDP